MNNKIPPHCVWIFGPPNTGKSTTAYNLLQKKLRNYIVIDGDKFRSNQTVKHTKEEIIEDHKHVLTMIKYLMGKGFNVLVAQITPFVEQRKIIKKELGKDCLLIYISCDESIRKLRKNYFDNDKNFEEDILYHDLMYKSDFFMEDYIIGRAHV